MTRDPDGETVPIPRYPIDPGQLLDEGLTWLVEQHYQLRCQELLTRFAEPVPGVPRMSAGDHLQLLAVDEAISRSALRDRPNQVARARAAGASWHAIARVTGAVDALDARAAYVQWLDAQEALWDRWIELGDRTAPQGIAPHDRERARQLAEFRLYTCSERSTLDGWSVTDGWVVPAQHPDLCDECGQGREPHCDWGGCCPGHPCDCDDGGDGYDPDDEPDPSTLAPGGEPDVEPSPLDGLVEQLADDAAYYEIDEQTGALVIRHSGLPVRVPGETLRDVTCGHDPQCPPYGSPGHDAARVVAFHPEQGWSRLCNGVITYADTGETLPDGRAIEPHRPEPGHRATAGAPTPTAAAAIPSETTV